MVGRLLHRTVVTLRAGACSGVCSGAKCGWVLSAACKAKELLGTCVYSECLQKISLILIIPSASCACAGASLIYPKLDYTLLLLPILYCVNRAPPENRMIMRFLPFHFCNPLQTDVNRLQSDAFQLQLRAFWMHLRVTSLRPTCTWMRGGCNGKFARIRAWAMENAAVEIRPGKFSATESSGKKYSPHAGGSAAGMGAVCALIAKRLGRGSCLA